MISKKLQLDMPCLRAFMYASLVKESTSVSLICELNHTCLVASGDVQQRHPTGVLIGSVNTST